MKRREEKAFASHLPKMQTNWPRTRCVERLARQASTSSVSKRNAQLASTCPLQEWTGETTTSESAHETSGESWQKPLRRKAQDVAGQLLVQDNNTVCTFIRARALVLKADLDAQTMVPSFRAKRGSKACGVMCRQILMFRMRSCALSTGL